MPANVLQRELDAYADAIDKYSRQGRSYSSAAKKHNEAVDAYRDAFIKNPAGEIAAYRLSRSGYVTQYGKSVSGFPSNDPNIVPIHFGDNIYGIQYKSNIKPKPAEFTRQQPTQPGAAPTATVGQLRRLDEPSLVDVERAGDKGLISSAFNY